MTPKRPTWHDRLKPYATALSVLHAAFEARLRDETDADLAKLVAATKHPTQGNCWWASYQVAPIVRDLAAAELFRRKRAAS